MHRYLGRLWLTIPGIHRFPYEPWNGVDRKVMGKKAVTADSRRGGYCAHSSILFGTWHRPYVAFFEVRAHPWRISSRKRCENQSDMATMCLARAMEARPERGQAT